MKKLKGCEIRQMWLDFFKSKGHEIIPSASLVPHNDPTLLWINAGVAPLKKYFDGREIPSNPRMTNAQKSIRTNDIDNVGRTSRHHTFFEMLGNFSIGDYFREEALTYAYELLFSDKYFGFDKDLIYITYYPEDHDTFNKWTSLGVAEDHLVPLKDNFWEIGEGPCGPDTEIFFDRGEKYDPDHLGIKMMYEDIENDRYIEIWNIVFSQFNSTPGFDREDYPELPSKNIDTGSGLERLACVLQETETNFETDLFMPMIKWLEDYTHVEYVGENQMAFRVIADHIRSVTFALADGALISSEGRGYVLRRILRRAVRYGKKLGINKPFLYKMVEVVVNNMKSFYGYLLEQQAIVEKLVKIEEENFFRTLESGEKRLNDIMSSNKTKTISGKDAFLLYDTFGFPIELTCEACADKGYDVDLDGFHEQLNLQKERARNARNDNQSMNAQNEAYLEFNELCTFVGYDTLTSTATVTGIFEGNKKVDTSCGKCVIVLDKTPFYAEMGGQVGDTGKLMINNQLVEVNNTFKLPNGQHGHVVDLNGISLSVNDTVEAIVNEENHQRICMNHSATHLLNAALRKVLGTHVTQHGSYVSANRLRFDFNHYTNLTREELLEIERLVNESINASYDVVTKELPIEEAKKTGAQAVFGEKYGDKVRVVDMNFSIEFCGGTHVSSTSEIKKLCILGIESKGSGIFRIEAATDDLIGEGIQNAIKASTDDILNIIKRTNEIAELCKKQNFNVVKPIINLPVLTYSYADVLNYRDYVVTARNLLKTYEKEYENLNRQANSADYKEYINKIEKNYIVEKVENIEIDVLKDIIDKITAERDDITVFFADVINNEKIIFIAKSRTKTVNCGMLVKNAAICCGGNGGGRPDFAQAGGKDVTKVDDALQAVKGLLN